MGDFYRRYMALATEASGLMTESHIVGLTDAFFWMDMDHDGVVTAADVHAVLGPEPDPSHTVDWDDFIAAHRAGDRKALRTNDEYVSGLKEGFLVFTDDVVRPGVISAVGAYREDFLRRITPACYDDDHVDGQVSYTEFMRLVIARRRAGATRPSDTPSPK